MLNLHQEPHAPIFYAQLRQHHRGVSQHLLCRAHVVIQGGLRRHLRDDPGGAGGIHSTGRLGIIDLFEDTWGENSGDMWPKLTKYPQVADAWETKRNMRNLIDVDLWNKMNQPESIWIYMKVPGVATSSDQPRYQHIPTTNPSVWFRRILLHWCVYIQGCAAIIIGGWLLLVGGWSNPESTWIYSIACQSCIAWKTVRRHWIACCCAIFAVCLLGLPFLFLAVLCSAWISWTHTGHES